MPENIDAFAIIADETSAGQRIDAFVSRTVTDCSRSFAAELIRMGRITLRGEKTVKPGYRLRPGDEIIGHIPPPSPVDVLPEPLPLDIIYQDKDIIVLNKPAGIVVHPAPAHASGTLVNALLYHCPDLAGIAGEIRPGIVHRLDKDTTGILIAAKNTHGQADLAKQFRSRTVQKQYLALVHGHLKDSSGRIILPIGRHPIDRKKMSTVTRSGREAETRWQVMECLAETSLLEIDLMTGRTHQIRVHLAAIHHAIVGDPVYGAKNTIHSPPIRRLLQPVKRQMLHAHRIRFQHPRSGADICFSAPLPPDMEEMINTLRTPNPSQ